MRLTPPIKQYLLGKLPTHSRTADLASHFEGISPAIFSSVLLGAGLLSEKNRRITAKAIRQGYVDVCEETMVWNLANVEKLLGKAGITASRVWANQEIKVNGGSEPKFVNLTALSTYFSVSAVKVGKWLDELGLRAELGLPTDEALRSGVAQVEQIEVSSNGQDFTRNSVKWDLVRTLTLLKDAGHPLDFDYKKTLAAKGKNSAVKVSSMDALAKEVAQEFSVLFNQRDIEKLKRLVKKYPLKVMQMAEVHLKRPGFITTGEYLRKLR